MPSSIYPIPQSRFSVRGRVRFESGETSFLPLSFLPWEKRSGPLIAAARFPNFSGGSAVKLAQRIRIGPSAGGQNWQKGGWEWGGGVIAVAGSRFPASRYTLSACLEIQVNRGFCVAPGWKSEKGKLLLATFRPGKWRKSVAVCVQNLLIYECGSSSAAGLECIINIIRALRMGSCVSTDGRGSNTLPCSPSSSGARTRRKDRRRRSSTQSFANEAKIDEQISRIPGRMFMNGASNEACLFTQQGRKGTNQDAMVVWEEFASRKDTVFCGVFDGHGPFGHLVAKRVRDSLPSKLCSQWEAQMKDDDGGIKEDKSTVGSMNSEETASVTMDDEWREFADAEEREKGTEIFLTLKESFLKAFKVMDKELRLHPSIDCFCSGTTAVTLVKQGQDLVIGNVGDSRAILGTRAEDNSLVAVQLTVDLKPNLPSEAERIRQCKGRVFALQDEPEVARVWLPHNDSPGLAMARAFGDFCLKDFGLIAVPDISYHRLTERDEFIVLATDGIWDVLSNKEVVDIVASAPTRTTAARALVEYAIRAWRLKYPTSKVDDCAVVCLFLQNSQPCKPKSKKVSTPESCAQQVTKEFSSVSSEAPNGEVEKKPDELLADGEANSPMLERSNTVRTFNDVNSALQNSIRIENMKELKCTESCQSQRSLGECISISDDEEWSALEGVTRVNTLLNLPRFLTGDKKTGGLKKWL